jgi:acyl-coenzyme A synthetase/AMP-(fatty) acid ligase
MSQQTIQEFVSPNGTVPHIPSNMTVAQFFLDYHHPNRPVRSETSPWLIDNDTGRSYLHEEIRTRTYALANIMKARWNVGDNDCVAFFTPNHVEFPITAWAVHRLGAIAAAANPAFSVDELLYQLNTTKAKLLIVHNSILSTGLEAAKLAGISEDRIIIIPNGDEPAPEGYQTLDELAEESSRLYPEPLFNESLLAEDEARTKIAVSILIAQHFPVR